MNKHAEFNIGKIRHSGQVFKENKLTVWVKFNLNFEKRIIKRHKAKHAVEFI